MPVEQQSRAPLRRRDKRFLTTLATVALAGGIAGGVVYGTSGGSSTRGRCVVVDLPSTVGGAHLTRCGAEARAFCRTESKRDPIVAEACRKHGFATS